MHKTLPLIITVFVSINLLCSELDTIIPPEIKNDSFYNAIYNLTKSETITTILEIGSSNGQGSTEAFVKGIRENASKPTLYCMEISKTRFKELKSYYQDVPFVKCYNVSSVPTESFPTEQEVRRFMDQIHTNLNMYGVERVVGWLKQDIEYIKSANVINNGIEHIKKENGIDSFDVVLIDGSEFSGIAEFKLIYGAKFILLDDINAFKNYNNYQALIRDSNYELVEENLELRNGYAVFKLKT